MEPWRVSTADFLRDVVRYQNVALSRPVVVTEDGRERTVLLSIEEYERLKCWDRDVLGLEDFSVSDIANLEASRPAAAASAFDHELDH